MAEDNGVLSSNTRLTDYTDTCVIERETGEYDKYDNPVKEKVYEGACLYEEGGQSYSSRIIVKNPLLILPTNDVLIYINDVVTVTTFKGRVIKSLVENVRDIAMKYRPEEITRIELKQATGK